jgi:hypothetical protein
VPDEERLGRRLADGLPYTDLHASEVIPVAQGAIARRPESLATGCGGSPSTPNAACAECAARRFVVSPA